jgi:hypothetical protein
MGKRSDEWSKCRRGEKIETRRPNKRVQSDAAAAAGSGARLGYVTCFELKGTSEKSRRG